MSSCIFISIDHTEKSDITFVCVPLSPLSTSKHTFRIYSVSHERALSVYYRPPPLFLQGVLLNNLLAVELTHCVNSTLND